MDWKHYQTVDTLQKDPQVGKGLFGIRLLILHFKFQFSKSIKSSRENSRRVYPALSSLVPAS